MPDNTFRNLVRLHSRQTRVGKFGQFRFSIFHPGGPDEGLVVAGGDAVFFLFNIVSTGIAVDTDFTSEVSFTPPGNTPSFGAAKFVNGPNDDSAFGATQTQPVAGPFQGQLVLSDQSSDSTPADDLDGTITFEVNFRDGSSGPQEVIVSVVASGDFNINEIYFNATDNIEELTGFTIIGGGGWDFAERL